MNLDVVHIRGVISSAMQIIFLQMCLRQDVFPAEQIGNMGWMESGGKVGTQTNCLIIPTAAYSNNQGRKNLTCSAMSQHD